MVGYGDERLDIPDDVLPDVAQLIRDCWNKDPTARPTFDQCLARLKEMPALTTAGAAAAVPAGRRPGGVQQQLLPAADSAAQ